MGEIYKNVLFENYANFKGRARRKQFWLFFFINGITSFVLSLISILNVFIIVYWAIIFIPSVAVAVRRMHDINKEWWYVLIPIYNVYLCTVMGDEGENKYGPDPISEMEYLVELGKDLN